jgi:FkbM family methyltransferase
MQNQTYYSQGGEDFLLSKLFPQKTDGFFVEVGCIDGRRFSNTLYFENRGWKGLCVEAHADYIPLLRKNRPGSTIVHAAVGDRDAVDTEFFANSRGSLSTLDRTKEKEFAAGYGEFFTGFQVQKVPMLTLTSIFRNNGVQDIDILSLDIEGYEVEALKGLDLRVYRPKVFVIESEGLEHRKEIEDILFPHGYYFIASLEQNLFYSVDREDRKAIGNRIFRGITIIHSGHPVDNAGDKELKIDVVTRERKGATLIRTIKKKMLSLLFFSKGTK